MSHWSQARKIQYVYRKHSYTFSSKLFCRRMDRITHFTEFVHRVFFKEEPKFSRTEDVPSSNITTLPAKYCLQVNNYNHGGSAKFESTAHKFHI
jgi:hypothetical protein